MFPLYGNLTTDLQWKLIDWFLHNMIIVKPVLGKNLLLLNSANVAQSKFFVGHYLFNNYTVISLPKKVLVKTMYDV